MVSNRYALPYMSLVMFLVTKISAVYSPGYFHNNTADWSLDSFKGRMMVKSTQTMLDRLLEDVSNKSNGTHKLHLYILGDSVSRMFLANWMFNWAGKPSAKSLQNMSQQDIKDMCSTHNRKGGLCSFDAEKFEGSFAWMQWFSHPNPLPPTVTHWQAWDACKTMPSLQACLTRVFNGSTIHDVSLIRMGLEYGVYGDAPYSTHACDRFMPICYLPNWKPYITNHAVNFIRLVNSTFPGTVVYTLLSPFGENKICRYPLSEVNTFIPAINDVLREIYEQENVLYIDPYKMHLPFRRRFVPRYEAQFKVFDPTAIGYFDCPHFAEPMTTLMFNRFLTTLTRQLPSVDLF